MLPARRLASRLASRLVPAIAVCLVLLTVVGCSRDIHVFRATATSPKNIAVVSATTGETLWSINVPEGQQLRLDFDRGEKDEVQRSPDTPAKTMKWELYNLDAVVAYGQKMKGGKKLDSGKVDLPEQETILSMTIPEPASGLGR